MSVTVRYAVHGDESAIVPLLQEFALATGTRCLAAEHTVSRYLAAADETVLLAVEDEAAVGLLSYSIRPDLLSGVAVAGIEVFVVLAERRGEGIGTMLLSAARHMLHEAEVRMLTAHVGAENAYAQHMLFAAGLTEASMRLAQKL